MIALGLNRLAQTFLPVAFVISGCAPAHQPAPATQPSTATTQPDFWLEQKPAAEVTFRDFQLLWNACEETARDYGFALDRQDYRGGVITTVPLVSKQFFVFWRIDAQTSARPNFEERVNGTAPSVGLPCRPRTISGSDHSLRRFGFLIVRRIAYARDASGSASVTQA